MKQVVKGMALSPQLTVDLEVQMTTRERDVGSDSDVKAKESPPSICYQMEPERQLLSSSQKDRHRAGTCQGHVVTANRVPPCLMSDQQHTTISLDDVTRVALMVTPQERGDAIDQAWEAVSTIRVILKQQSDEMSLVQQTVFVRNAKDIPLFENLMRAYFGERMPATSFVVQPPCGGQALAIEAWAIGGKEVETTWLARDVVEVCYDKIRWVYVSGITPPLTLKGSYDQTKYCFETLQERLAQAGCSFRDVPRVWLYQGHIISPEEESNAGFSARETISERYRELNRARSDFFDDAISRDDMLRTSNNEVIYPASTGIGTQGDSLLLSGMAIQTNRPDIHLVRLENPMQTSAFDYEKKFSIKSPKFSRAMACAMPAYATIWVSGTASILNSETVHVGDVIKQTHQTIDNIQQLISPSNLAAHGYENSGASLSDLAKVRVYVKHEKDFDACRQVCRERFGHLPTIFAIADVCRPDLLVEIEGVAFSENATVISS